MNLPQFSALATIALLAGCVTPANELVWYNPRKSQHEADQDVYAARYEAAKSSAISSPSAPVATGSAAAGVDAMRKKEVMETYLQSRGYRLIKKSEVPTAKTSFPDNRNTTTSHVPAGGIQPFLYSHEGSYLEILSVPNSPNEPQRIKVGDRVLEIDGVAIRGLSMIQVHRSLTGKIGEIKKLQVQLINGTISTVSVALVKDQP